MGAPIDLTGRQMVRAVRTSHPDEARELLAAAQHWVDEKYRVYQDMAARDGSRCLAEAE